MPSTPGFTLAKHAFQKLFEIDRNKPGTQRACPGGVSDGDLLDGASTLYIGGPLWVEDWDNIKLISRFYTAK